jgi:hypothetical protein
MRTHSGLNLVEKGGSGNALCFPVDDPSHPRESHHVQALSFNPSQAKGRNPMTATEDHAGNRPTADPTPEVQRHKHTCGGFAVLEICEQAYRDLTGKPLSLTQFEARTRDIKHHLEVEKCEICNSWYRTALRTYQKPPEELRPSPPGVIPLPRLAALPREPKPSVLAAEGRADSEVVQELPPAPAGSGLDRLPGWLEWKKETQPAPAGKQPRWWVTLRFLSRKNAPAGTKESRLRAFEGYLVTLRFTTATGEEADLLETRLGFDPHGNLVSTTKPARVRPDGYARLTIQLQDRVAGPEPS